MIISEEDFQKEFDELAHIVLRQFEGQDYDKAAEILKRCDDVLNAKAQEYASDECRFQNFSDGCEYEKLYNENATPITTLFGYMTKHVCSIDVIERKHGISNEWLTSVHYSEILKLASMLIYEESEIIEFITLLILNLITITEAGNERVEILNEKYGDAINYTFFILVMVRKGVR